MLGLLVALSGPPPPVPPWFGTAGRVYTSPAIHVGVRPALFVAPSELDVGLTVQVTIFVL
jgi:hypothetical protein